MNDLDAMAAALLSAKAHVVRQQFYGKHAQDRIDATEWIRLYGKMVDAIRSRSRQMPVKWSGNL